MLGKLGRYATYQFMPEQNAQACAQGMSMCIYSMYKKYANPSRLFFLHPIPHIGAKSHAYSLQAGSGVSQSQPQTLQLDEYGMYALG